MNNVDISYTFIAKAMLRDSLLCAAPRAPLRRCCRALRPCRALTSLSGPRHIVRPSGRAAMPLPRRARHPHLVAGV